MKYDDVCVPCNGKDTPPSTVHGTPAYDLVTRFEDSLPGQQNGVIIDEGAKPHPIPQNARMRSQLSTRV